LVGYAIALSFGYCRPMAQGCAMPRNPRVYLFDVTVYEALGPTPGARPFHER
jgi:hypothetical protein